MSQAEIAPTDIQQDPAVLNRDLGISDLIQSLSSRATKRSAFELECPELHQVGLEKTSKIRELVQVIKRKRLNSEAAENTDLTDPDILSAFSYFTHIKHINRRMQQQNLVKKDDLKLKKEKANTRYLILKAREAELQLLKDQIFMLKKQSELVEDINILPEENFDVQATEPYTGHSNDHEKMLNRLKFELHQRKKLNEQLQEVNKNKTKVFLHSSNFKKDITKIKSQTLSLVNACETLSQAVNKIKSTK